MSLTDQIRSAVNEGRFVVGVNARNRLEERRVALFQIETGLIDGNIVELPDRKPSPAIVVDQGLMDGTQIVVIWYWLAFSNQAKLASVFFPDQGESWAV